MKTSGYQRGLCNMEINAYSKICKTIVKTSEEILFNSTKTGKVIFSGQKNKGKKKQVAFGAPYAQQNPI